MSDVVEPFRVGQLKVESSKTFAMDSRRQVTFGRWPHPGQAVHKADTDKGSFYRAARYVLAGRHMKRYVPGLGTV